MKVVAKAKYLKTSAQKLRLSADLVRGQKVNDALAVLKVTNKKTAGFVYEAIKSAASNAENNHNLNRNSLVIDKISVDQGPRLNRVRPRSRGMAHSIIHPMAHITVVLDEETKQQPKPATKKVEKAQSAGKETK